MSVEQVQESELPDPRKHSEDIGADSATDHDYPTEHELENE